MKRYMNDLNAYVDSRTGLLSLDNLEPSMSMMDRIGGYARGLGKRWKEGLMLSTALLLGCASEPEFLKWDYGKVIRKTPYEVSVDGTMSWWELTDKNWWVYHGDRPGTKKDDFAAFGPYRVKPPDEPPVKKLKFGEGVTRNIAEGIAGKN